MSTPLAVKPLYHFTCIDGHQLIGTRNCLLIPQPACWPVIWMTDQAVPDFEATGLLSVNLTCDRTEFRYVVTDVSTCRPWLRSPERAACGRYFRELLEQFGKPDEWWISSEPVRATWDASWRKEQAS